MMEIVRLAYKMPADKREAVSRASSTGLVAQRTLLGVTRRFERARGGGRYQSGFGWFGCMSGCEASTGLSCAWEPTRDEGTAAKWGTNFERDSACGHVGDPQRVSACDGLHKAYV